MRPTPATFRDLGRRRKVLLLREAYSMKLALRLVEKYGGTQIAKRVITEGLNYTSKMDNVEIDRMVDQIEKDMTESPHSFGLRHVKLTPSIKR